MSIKPITAAIGLAGFFAALYAFGNVPAYAAAAVQGSPNVAVSPAAQQETVSAGDTLSGIANKYQTTYVRLYDANGQIGHPDIIHPGEVVRIPAPDEQLASRPLPDGAAGQTAETASAATADPVVAAPAVRPVQSAAPASGNAWDQLAQCEAGGNWSINTGNGFYGGLQFTLSSWQAVGGSGYPHQASREQQIAMGEKLLALQGWGAWPACSSKLGLR